MEYLEKKKILGINYNPKNKASCIANFKKIIEVLKKNPKIDMKYLLDENALLQASTEYIMKLLENIRNAYLQPI